MLINLMLCCAISVTEEAEKPINIDVSSGALMEIRAIKIDINGPEDRSCWYLRVL